MQRPFDLLAYRGKTIRIYFHGSEDSYLETSFIVDDVALNSTQWRGGAPALRYKRVS